MYVCVYVHMHTDMYVHIHIHTRNVSACVCLSACVTLFISHMHIYCTCTVYMHACMHACILYIYVCICVYAHIIPTILKLVPEFADTPSWLAPGYLMVGRYPLLGNNKAVSWGEMDMGSVRVTLRPRPCKPINPQPPRPKSICELVLCFRFKWMC